MSKNIFVLVFCKRWFLIVYHLYCASVEWHGMCTVSCWDRIQFVINKKKLNDKTSFDLEQICMQ